MIPSPTPPEPRSPYYLIRTKTGIHAVSVDELDPRDEIIYANDFPSLRQAEMTAAMLRKVAEFDDQPPPASNLAQEIQAEIDAAQAELEELERKLEELTK
jgi:HD-like signal output (HDOD) protein